MKCIKNLKNGNILRVEDNVAYNMVGSTWQYIPKSEWRKSQGLKEETVIEKVESEVKVEKKEKKSKKVSK